MAIRLQVACNDVLVAEAVVVSLAEADRAFARYACAKYRKGLPVGGAVIQRADLPRQWDVPVGASVLSSVCAWCADSAQRTADATMAGRVVSHGICERHAAEFMERR